MTQYPEMKEIAACRACGSADLTEIVAFGDAPIADRLMRPEDTSVEYVAPLTLVHCENCALCQIRETVAPRILFGPDYPYFSSVSPALMKHFRSSAEALIKRRGLGPESLVMEAASNDGYMLLPFVEQGVPVLGVDPADGPVKVAREKGVDTVHDFFTHDLAKRLAAEGKRADLFLANNVLAHVAETNDFVAGIATLLAEDGMAVIECPYLLDLVAHGEFDTIYHQHLLYLSLTALVPLFARHGLHLNDVERLKIHGGSLRLFITREPGQSETLRAHLEAEDALQASSSAFYADFTAKIARMRDETRAAITALKAEGKRVAGYGAAAKATTLLHYFGLTADDLDFIVDKSTWKQGLEMPVTRIPIVPPEHLSRETADTVLILAWNFANEIARENTAFTDAGGTFLAPVPELRVVGQTSEEVSL